MFRFSPTLFLALVLCMATALRAAPTPAEAMRLLKTNCFSCHNEQKKKGGLVMTSREALLKGGDNGAALDLDASRRKARCSPRSRRMPIRTCRRRSSSPRRRSRCSSSG